MGSAVVLCDVGRHHAVLSVVLLPPALAVLRSVCERRFLSQQLGLLALWLAVTC
jgi:hypothetical protein